MRLSTKVHLALGGVVASTLILATPALASPGRGGPGPSDQANASGRCSGQATWKLKAKDDDGRIQAEFEVDGILSNRTWHVTLADNGTVFFAGNRHRTDGDSFTVEAGTHNQAGPDRIAATATNTVTGQTCQGAVSV